MESFQKLLQTFDVLLSEKGCPWDRKQTFDSLQPYLIEEVYEVLEAIDQKNFVDLQEELGDLLLSIVFLSKLAEKEKKFTMKDVLDALIHKLIIRHPHVFDAKKELTPDEVVTQWGDIKKVEKAHRKSALEGIPNHLPSLQKAQKMLKRMQKLKFLDQSDKTITEDDFNQKMFALLQEAEHSNIHAENVFRKYLDKKAQEFLEFEKKSIGDDLEA